MGQAQHDESGGINGPVQGDQNNEVVTLPWYARNTKGVGWGWVLRCKNAKMREALAVFVETACGNAGIGYSQPNRTQLLKAIKAGATAANARGDCDCTSLIFTALIFAGLSVKMGYSGSMYRLLMATGMFDSFTDAEHLLSDRLAVRGDIYLRVGHAATVLEDGAGVSASVNQGAAEGLSGAYIRILDSGLTVNVRPLPGTAPSEASAVERKKYNPIYVASSGELFPVIRRVENGWYMIDSPRGVGYVSDKIPRYVEYVEEELEG